MKSEKLLDRIAAAFPGAEENPMSPTDYLDIVRLHWRTAEDTLRRTTLGLLVVAALFVLVSEAGVAEFDLGPIRITDLTIIQKAVPVVFAYLTLEWVTLGILINRLGSVHDAVVERVQPDLKKAYLQLLLAPAVMSLAGEARVVGEPGRMHNLMQGFTVVKTLFFIAALIVLQGYFQWSQFTTFGVADVGVWIALIPTAVFLIQTGLYLPRFGNDPTWSL